MSESKEIKYSDNHQVIYVDHMIRFGVGPMISKIDFFVIDDLDKSKIEISKTIAMPTNHFYDAMKLISEQLKTDKVKDDVLSKLKEAIKKIEG